MNTPFKKPIINDRERMRLHDCWHGFFDDNASPFERVQRDVDYVRGFAQGVAFMRMHSHRLTHSKFQRLWVFLVKARSETKLGKTCLPLLRFLEHKFKLSRDKLGV